MVDSGGSTYATSRCDIFLTYETDDLGVVCMGNSGKANVIGIGEFLLKIAMGLL